MIKRNMTTLRKLMLLNGVIGGIFSEDTAIGNPLTFITNVAKPLKSLLIPFLPIQEGTGDPSPSNIRPIVPWEGLSFNHSEENLIDVSVFPSKLSGGITYTNNGDGSITLNGECTAFNPQAIALPVNLPAGKYYFTVNNDKAKTGTGNVYIGMNDINGTDYGASLGSENARATINAGAPLRRMFINIFAGAELDNITIKPMLVSGEGYADFKPYTGEKHDISFPSPVYGGTLDVVSGVLTVTMVARTYNGTEEGWSNQSANVTTRAIVWNAVRGAKIGDNRIIACNCLKPSNINQDEAPLNGILNTTQTWNIRLRVSQDAISFEAFRTFLQENPVTVVCPLVTPQEITLTPAQITALKGDNTIWSDADGQMTATYLKKG